MSVIRSCTMWKGDFRHLSYIFCNPEPLGTKFKTVDCYVTGSLIFLENQLGEEGMELIRFHFNLEAMAVCNNRLMEDTKELGEKSLKGSTSYCFLFYRWFLSNKT